MFDEIRTNLKHLPTTLSGILTLLSVLPQNEFVQKLMELNPQVADIVTGVAAVAAGLILVFGMRKNVVKEGV